MRTLVLPVPVACLRTNLNQESFKIFLDIPSESSLFKSEDDLDVGEEFTRAGAEIKYNIASGLDAFISVDDYDYKINTANHESTNTSNDSGTMTQLTIKASF